MTIGKKIKQLRKSRDLTQEDLAEMLGISVSAVSQWESDKTAPDLSMFPALCNYFNVTSDELLGIDIYRKEEEIKRLRYEIDDLTRLGKQKEAYTRCKEALSHYPDSFYLMEDMASSIFWMIEDRSTSDEEKKVLFADQGRLYQTILDKCTDEKIRMSVIPKLAEWYAKSGEEEKSHEIISTLPFIVNSREFTGFYCSKGSERLDNRQRLMYQLIQHLSNHMVQNNKYDSGELMYSESDIAALHEKRIELFKLLYEKGDYGFYNDALQDSYLTVARYAAKNGDDAKAIDCLTYASEAAIAFVAYLRDDGITHTSILFRGYETSSGGVYCHENENSAALLLNNMACGAFDSIRDTAEFKEIESRLKESAGNWA